MQTIYKYPLEMKDRQVLSLPLGFEILHITPQAGYVMLWAKVDTEVDEQDVEFITAFTGHPLPSDAGQHISTYILQGEGLVFHVFLSK